jgi:NADH-quinone oxidoreductase subunit M
VDVAAIPFLLVLWPLSVGLLIAVVPMGPRLARAVALVAAIGELLLVAYASLAFETPPAMAAGAGSLALEALGFATVWLPTTGSDLALAIDGLNQFGLLALAASLILAVAIEGRFENGVSRARLALALAATAGLALLITTRDLMLAAAGYGLAGLALAVLVGLGSDRDSQRAGRRLATWAAAGTVLFAAGAAVFAIGAGTTFVDDLAGMPTNRGPVAAALLTLAAAMQIPLLPLHTWLVPVCTSGAMAGRVLVVGGWCTIGVFGLLRFGLSLFPAEALALSPWPAAWAASSAAWGAALAMVQAGDHLHRRVALVVLSTGGLMAAGAFGLGSLQALGATALAAGHALPRAGLLVLAVWIMREGGGGLRIGAAWLTLALITVAAPGGSTFPGWLTSLTGTLAATPGLGWLLLVTTGVAGLALLAPTVELTRAPSASPAPSALRWAWTLIVAIAVLTGLRPEPFMAWARPDMERLLSRVPEDAAPTAPEEVDPTPPPAEDDP